MASDVMPVRLVGGPLDNTLYELEMPLPEAFVPGSGVLRELRLDAPTGGAYCRNRMHLNPVYQWRDHMPEHPAPPPPLPEEIIGFLRRATELEGYDVEENGSVRVEARNILNRYVPEFTREQALEKENAELRRELASARQSATRWKSEHDRVAREVQRFGAMVNAANAKIKQMKATQHVIELPGGYENVLAAVRSVLDLAGIDPAAVHVGERPLPDDEQTGDTDAPEVTKPAARRSARGRGDRGGAQAEPGGAAAGTAEPGQPATG